MMAELLSKEYFMKEALKEANKAFELNEIPVGAVVVCQDRIVARAHNLTEQLNDVTAHAEMQAFTAASNCIGAKYLNECTLYVTIEPCVMCAGAAYWAQIGEIVYGASDEKKGYSSIAPKIIHPKTKVIQGILENDCKELMQRFFLKMR